MVKAEFFLEVTPCLKRKKTDKTSENRHKIDSENYTRERDQKNQITHRKQLKRDNDHDFQDDYSKQIKKKTNYKVITLIGTRDIGREGTSNHPYPTMSK